VTIQMLVRESAQADLRDAFNWYQDKLPGLGAEFMEAVEIKLKRIESNPLQFPILRGHTRRAIVTRFPYGIFVVFNDDVVAVLAVMHHARAPVHWQRRT
jgi:toxin ParE1/3/4